MQQAFERYVQFATFMKKESEYEFLLRAENGQIYLKIDEVFGFPMETCHWGGYDTRSSIEINSSNYSVRGTVYISTGELYQFYTELSECYKTLNGKARLHSYENNLEVVASFDGFGHVDLSGFFKERHDQDNELKFQLFTDQTTIYEALAGLSDIHDKYGEMKGIKERSA